MDAKDPANQQILDKIQADYISRLIQENSNYNRDIIIRTHAPIAKVHNFF